MGGTNYIRFHRLGLTVDILDTRTGEILAWCYLGDEDNVEKIADILSAKGQREAAHELREMARSDRRVWLLRKPPQQAKVRRMVLGA